MDNQEGFGGAVEGAGCQGVSPAGDHVAQVVVRVGGFPEGEPGDGPVAAIPVVEPVSEGVQEVA